MRIKDICDINAFSISVNDEIDNIQYLDTSNLTENEIGELQSMLLSEAPSRAQRRVKNNTILYSTVRPNQKHYGILSNPCHNLIASTGFATLDIKESLKNEYDAHFLYYLLTQNWVTTYLQTLAENSVSSYPSINASDIGNLNFTFPNIEVQQQIASILKNIDDKTVLNRSINRNLEALAKQLYDYWFVQFDFPDENGRPYKSSGGKMVWNDDIQMSIPYGWDVCRLSDFIGKNNTGDWGTDEPSGNSIEIGCIRGADILSLNDLPKRYIKSNKVEKLLTEWDVVIEVSGGSPVQATGRSAYITPGVIKRNGGNISCSNFCHAFSFKDYRDSAYFFYVWNMFYDNGIMFNYEGKTSGIKNFMTDVFLANKWINGPKTLIVKFYNVIKEIYAKMDANVSENNRLVKQRDELLPLLMNGQVEVMQLNSDLSLD